MLQLGGFERLEYAVYSHLDALNAAFPQFARDVAALFAGTNEDGNIPADEDLRRAVRPDARLALPGQIEQLGYFVGRVIGGYVD